MSPESTSEDEATRAAQFRADTFALQEFDEQLPENLDIEDEAQDDQQVLTNPNTFPENSSLVDRGLEYIVQKYGSQFANITGATGWDLGVSFVTSYVYLWARALVTFFVPETHTPNELHRLIPPYRFDEPWDWGYFLFAFMMSILLPCIALSVILAIFLPIIMPFLLGMWIIS